MGILADSFRARLDEMRERHAQTDRELIEARDRVLKAMEDLKQAAEDFTAD